MWGKCPDCGSPSIGIGRHWSPDCDERAEREESGLNALISMAPKEGNKKGKP